MYTISNQINKYLGRDMRRGPQQGAWALAIKSKDAMQGYKSWNSQKARCNNPKNPKYKYYGDKGIKVTYSSREFIDWWLDQLKTQEWKDPTIGRIDHSKNYSFDNIKMEERSDNSKERIQRVGRKGLHPSVRAVIAIDMVTGKKLAEYVSMALAEKETGISLGNIYSICRGLRKGTRKNITFRYKDES